MRGFTKTAIVMLLMLAMFVIVGCNKQEDKDVRVTTYTPQDVSQTMAVCGGDVIVTQGLSLNELGVCWSKERNPTADDAHLSTTIWNEPFVCTIMGLESGTTYHVRAFALRGLEYYYGEDKSFTTEVNGGNGTFNGHEYVDLGLPSGILWAICNVGAETPEDYGDYFAWGETQPKSVYNWNTYKYCMGSRNTLTKYCCNSNYGYNGFTDNLIALQAMDDAASVNWGAGWRTPTAGEWIELLRNTTKIWTTQNSVQGYLFIAKNGRSLFLPKAGRYWEVELDISEGDYWSSSLGAEGQLPPEYFVFFDGLYEMDDFYNRCSGLSVRPVCSSSQN